MVVRVRLRAPTSALFEGVLVDVDSASLTINEHDRRLTLWPGQIQRVERRVGSRPKRPAFVNGAALGLVAGGALAIVIARSTSPGYCRNCEFFKPSSATIISIPLVASFTVLGGVIGVARRTEWAEVRYP
jgi:hypothetical protein